MRYQINSKRKHFYVCQLCSLVYVSAKALRNHYSSAHPDLPCDVVELDPDPIEENFYDFGSNMNNSFMYKDDIYSISNNIPTNSSIHQVSQAQMFNNFNNTDNNSYQNDSNNQYTQLNVMSYEMKSSEENIAPILKMALVTNNNVEIEKIAKKSTPLPNQTPMMTQVEVLQKNTFVTSPSNEKMRKTTCEICQKTFASIYNKKRHDDMVHKQNKQIIPKFKCSSCDKTFSSIYNKTRHENVHKPITERLKFRCVIDNCNKVFTTQFILKTHMKRAHKVEPNF